MPAPPPTPPEPHPHPHPPAPERSSGVHACAVSWLVCPLARPGRRGAWLGTMAGGGREPAPKPRGKLSLAPATFQLFTAQLLLISFLQSPQEQFSHVSTRQLPRVHPRISLGGRGGGRGKNAGTISSCSRAGALLLLGPRAAGWRAFGAWAVGRAGRAWMGCRRPGHCGHAGAAGRGWSSLSGHSKPCLHFLGACRAPPTHHTLRCSHSCCRAGDPGPPCLSLFHPRPPPGPEVQVQMPKGAGREHR